ncbi:MAG: hypothetical protein V2I65_05270 [Paracoccaceae bacterium]|nr:hypothetical protein [Paracoccaceae bacterium]
MRRPALFRPSAAALLLLAAFALAACGEPRKTAPRPGLPGDGAVIADLAPLPPTGDEARP